MLRATVTLVQDVKIRREGRNAFSASLNTGADRLVRVGLVRVAKAVNQVVRKPGWISMILNVFVPILTNN